MAKFNPHRKKSNYMSVIKKEREDRVVINLLSNNRILFYNDEDWSSLVLVLGLLPLILALLLADI